MYPILSSRNKATNMFSHCWRRLVAILSSICVTQMGIPSFQLWLHAFAEHACFDPLQPSIESIIKLINAKECYGDYKSTYVYIYDTVTRSILPSHFPFCSNAHFQLLVYTTRIRIRFCVECVCVCELCALLSQRQLTFLSHSISVPISPLISLSCSPLHQILHVPMLNQSFLYIYTSGKLRAENR